MGEESTSTVIYGSDEGLVCSEALRTYRSLAEGTDEYNHEIIDGTCANVSEVEETCLRTVSALRTLPFFPGRKIVWLKNANFFGDSQQAKAETTLQAIAGLVETLGNLPPNTFFLLSASEIDKRRTWFKQLSQIAACKEYAKIDTGKQGWETELASCVTREGKARGLTFDTQALELFIHRVNETSRQIANELDKLDIYLGAERRRITEEDVQDMVAVSRSGVIFEISRALELRHAHQAIALIDEQLDSGEQAISIMRAAIIPTIRNSLMAKTLMENYQLSPTNYRDFESKVKNLPLEAKSLIPLKKDGTPNTYPLFLAAQKCTKQTLPQIKRAIAACASADKALVSSGLDARDILHKLIVTITA